MTVCVSSRLLLSFLKVPSTVKSAAVVDLKFTDFPFKHLFAVSVHVFLFVQIHWEAFRLEVVNTDLHLAEERTMKPVFSPHCSLVCLFCSCVSCKSSTVLTDLPFGLFLCLHLLLALSVF